MLSDWWQGIFHCFGIGMGGSVQFPLLAGWYARPLQWRRWHQSHIGFGVDRVLPQQKKCSWSQLCLFFSFIELCVNVESLALHDLKVEFFLLYQALGACRVFGFT